MANIVRLTASDDEWDRPVPDPDPSKTSANAGVPAESIGQELIAKTNRNEATALRYNQD